MSLKILIPVTALAMLFRTSPEALLLTMFDESLTISKTWPVISDYRYSISIGFITPLIRVTTPVVPVTTRRAYARHFCALFNAFICLRSALNPASLAAVCALVETSRMLTLGCLVLNLVTAAIALTRIGSNSSSRAASKCTSGAGGGVSPMRASVKLGCTGTGTGLGLALALAGGDLVLGTPVGVGPVCF